MSLPPASSFTVRRTITKLVIGSGEPPLILFHGAGGLALEFFKYKDVFTTGLWLVQMTPSTPLTSFADLISFYCAQIRAEQPTGPYRFAGYSGSSMIALGVAREFELHGEDVIQLAFLDHFPTIHLHQSNSIGNPDVRTPLGRERVMKNNIEGILRLCGLDKAERAMALQEAFDADSGSNAIDVPIHMRVTACNIKKIILLIGEFLYDLTTFDGVQDVRLLARWMYGMKVKMTVYAASVGAANLYSRGEKRWDLGAGQLASTVDVKVVRIEGHHFNFFMSEKVVRDLQSVVYSSVAPKL